MTDLGLTVDNLVADLIATSSRHVEVSREAIERLTTQYPELVERYGDFNLGLNFGGSGGRILRADIHKRLAAKVDENGKQLTQGQIAALTGVSRPTVQRDLAGSREQPGERGAGSDEQPTSRDAALTDEQRAIEARLARKKRWSSAWAKASAALSTLEYEVVEEMTNEQQNVERTHVEFLRHVADRLEKAMSQGMKLVAGGKS